VGKILWYGYERLDRESKPVIECKERDGSVDPKIDDVIGEGDG
jgi:hypothetical protein